MVRILGINLPDNKRIEYALTLLYGVGRSNVKKLLKEAAIDVDKKVKDISEVELKRILVVLDAGYKIEGDLKEEITDNIKRLREISSYRGIRHVRNLPVRGQRTRSNARTKRGKRKTVGALRKEVWAKLEQNKSGATDSAKPAAK